MRSAVVADCAGSWSACEAGCADKTYTVTTAALGGGDVCSTADGATATCIVGDGACILSCVVEEDACADFEVVFASTAESSTHHTCEKSEMFDLQKVCMTSCNANKCGVSDEAKDKFVVTEEATVKFPLEIPVKGSITKEELEDPVAKAALEDSLKEGLGLGESAEIENLKIKDSPTPTPAPTRMRRLTGSGGVTVSFNVVFKVDLTNTTDPTDTSAAVTNSFSTLIDAVETAVAGNSLGNLIAASVSTATNTSITLTLDSAAYVAPVETSAVAAVAVVVTVDSSYTFVEAVDCVGSWSACGAGCSDKTYTIAKDQVGAGAECPAATGATEACVHGDGACGRSFYTIQCNS